MKLQGPPNSFGSRHVGFYDDDDDLNVGWKVGRADGWKVRNFSGSY